MKLIIYVQAKLAACRRPEFRNRFASSGRSANGFRGGRSFGGGGRRIRSFDPSSIVENLKKPDAPVAVDEVFEPKHAFSDFAVSELIKQNVLARSYKTPTPIQDQVIPLVLDGKDVVGVGVL